MEITACVLLARAKVQFHNNIQFLTHLRDSKCIACGWLGVPIHCNAPSHRPAAQIEKESERNNTKSLVVCLRDPEYGGIKRKRIVHILFFLSFHQLATHIFEEQSVLGSLEPISVFIPPVPTYVQ